MKSRPPVAQSTLILTIPVPSEPPLRLKRPDSPLSRRLLARMGYTAHKALLDDDNVGLSLSSGPAPAPGPARLSPPTLVCVTVEHIPL